MSYLYMGKENTVIGERMYQFSGVFDVRSTFNDIMNFIEETLIYDVKVKERTENTGDDFKEIKSIFEIDKRVGQHSRVTLKLTIDMKGKEKMVEVDGKEVKVMNSSCTLLINGYTNKDFNKYFTGDENKKLRIFLFKFYHKYIKTNEDTELLIHAYSDVDAIVKRFKSHTNSTIK